MTEAQIVDSTFFKRECASESGDDSDSDPNIREAKRLSLADINTEPTSTPMPHESNFPNAVHSAPGDIRRHFRPASAATVSGSRDLPVRQNRQKEDVVEGDMYVVTKQVKDHD